MCLSKSDRVSIPHAILHVDHRVKARKWFCYVKILYRWGKSQKRTNGSIFTHARGGAFPYPWTDERDSLAASESHGRKIGAWRPFRA